MGDYARGRHRDAYVDDDRKAAEEDQAWAEYAQLKGAATPEAWSSAPAQAEEGRAR